MEIRISMTISDKVWVITGVSRGIGKAIAELALKAGAKVFGTVRRAEDADHLKTSFPEKFNTIVMDLNDPDQVEQAANSILKTSQGKIDVLVNNAGYGLQGVIEEVSMDQVRRQMETNFFGLVHFTKLILPQMRANNAGYIVNVSSIAGLRGSRSLGIYNASKFAVVGFSEALAEELEPFGINVSIVEPGPYRTDWAGSSLDRSGSMTTSNPDSPYYDLNERIRQFYAERDGKQPGDPYQIAEVLLEASVADQPPLHMIFGDVAIHLWESRREQFDDDSFMKSYPHTKREL